jgi:hypothetical protein
MLNTVINIVSSSTNMFVSAKKQKVSQVTAECENLQKK